jgi:hypothetical protein
MHRMPADRPKLNPSAKRLPVPLPEFLSSPARSSKKHLDLTMFENEDTKKRSLDDENASEPIKKTRVEAPTPPADRNADGQNSTEKLKGTEGRPKRGAKRVLGDEEDDLTESKRTGGKRLRKISKEHRIEEPDRMVLDDDSENAPLKSLSRGKKRDRAEAGSTFGGNDDEDDSNSGSEDEEGYQIRQRRKRRTVAKRKSEAYSRGRKRDRDADWQDSEDEEDQEWPKSRKKREKRYSEDEGYQGSDVSMDGSQISRDPLCKGRRIGDEWEVSGVQYKVGLNGERLRQALVKKARSKFVMASIDNLVLNSI